MALTSFFVAAVSGYVMIGGPTALMIGLFLGSLGFGRWMFHLARTGYAPGEG